MCKFKVGDYIQHIGIDHADRWLIVGMHKDKYYIEHMTQISKFNDELAVTSIRIDNEVWEYYRVMTEMERTLYV